MKKKCYYASTALAVFVCIAYCALLFLQAQEDLLYSLKIAVLSALPFLLVSLLRRWLNLPRPEAGEPDALHRAGGGAFPSRHAYSAFFISVLFLRFYPFYSIPLFLAAFSISVLRVLARVHSLADVLGGAVFGTAFGAVTLLFL